MSGAVHVVAGPCGCNGHTAAFGPSRLRGDVTCIIPRVHCVSCPPAARREAGSVFPCAAEFLSFPRV